MKKKILLLLANFMVVAALVGCGESSISNETITISKYKGLEVEADSDDLEADVWEALLANCMVTEYEANELASLVEELELQYSYVAYYEGKEASELIEETHGMTAEELAKEQLKKEYAISLIAEKEDLKLSSEEYEEELAEKAEENGLEDSKEYENMYGKEELEKSFLEGRVLEFLIENLK